MIALRDGIWQVTYLSLINVIIVPLIRPSNDHHDEVLAVVRTKVVHGRLQEVLVLGDPFGEVEGWWQRHSLDDRDSTRTDLEP